MWSNKPNKCKPNLTLIPSPLEDGGDALIPFMWTPHHHVDKVKNKVIWGTMEFRENWN